jgi:hypothetical protein
MWKRRIMESEVESDGDRSERLARDIASMKWKVNVIWYLLVTAVVAAGGSAFAVGGWLIERGAKEEAHSISHKLLEQHGADHERRLREVEVLVQQTAQRVTDHLTGHASRRSDSSWQQQPSPLLVPPSNVSR